MSSEKLKLEEKISQLEAQLKGQSLKVKEFSVFFFDYNFLKSEVTPKQNEERTKFTNRIPITNFLKSDAKKYVG